MWHVQEYRITAQALEQRLGISSFETYLVRRRLRWLGHVRRMPWHRLPRKLLTSWVAEPRVLGGQQMTYGRSILEDIRLAEEAGMVFPVAEVEVASEDEEGDGLEGLTVPELRERGRVLGVVPVGTDRDTRRSEPWVEALRVARATAQHTAAVVAAGSSDSSNTGSSSTCTGGCRSSKRSLLCSATAAHAQRGKLRRLATRCACGRA